MIKMFDDTYIDRLTDRQTDGWMEITSLCPLEFMK